MYTTQSVSDRFDTFIFDLDGTVLLGDDVIPGAKQLILHLLAQGKEVLYLTNNATHSREDYAALLSKVGLPTRDEQVVNSTLVLVDYLSQSCPGTTVQVVGEPPLVNALQAAGFTVVEDGSAKVVVASFDRSFTYAKLQSAFDAIRAGARLVATNQDRYRPTQDGGEPDAASTIAAIEACTGVTCETVVGKPSVHTARYILARVGSDPERCILFGDRIETDVRMANEAGISSALVLTGATKIEDLKDSQVAPSFVFADLAAAI